MGLYPSRTRACSPLTCGGERRTPHPRPTDAFTSTRTHRMALTCRARLRLSPPGKTPRPKANQPQPHGVTSAGDSPSPHSTTQDTTRETGRISQRGHNDHTAHDYAKDHRVPMAATGHRESSCDTGRNGQNQFLTLILSSHEYSEHETKAWPRTAALVPGPTVPVHGSCGVPRKLSARSARGPRGLPHGERLLDRHGQEARP